MPLSWLPPWRRCWGYWSEPFVAYAEDTRSATPGCKLTSIRADDDNVNIERQAQSSYRGGRTHEKERGDCGPSGLLGAVVSWTRLRNRKSPSAARASSNEQCKTS